MERIEEYNSSVLCLPPFELGRDNVFFTSMRSSTGTNLNVQQLRMSANEEVAISTIGSDDFQMSRSHSTSGYQ